MRHLCLVLVSIILGNPSVQADDGSNTSTGKTRLKTGVEVVYDYHFDRNAFAGSVDLPGGLIALTRSGNLLRFNRETLKITREWSGPSMATCLGTGDNGQALVGFEDGRIATLDPANLALTTVATLPGKPHWVGVKRGEGAGIVAVVEHWRWVDASRGGLSEYGFRDLPVLLADPQKPIRPVKTILHKWSSESVVYDLVTGKSCAIGGRAISVFLDRRNRLWFGYAMGEFAGWCRCVDVSGGQPKLIRGPFDPADGGFPLKDCISGFVEPRDGRIWALGGIDDITIYRVDAEKLETPLHLESKGFDEVEKGFGPDKPDSPLLWMAEEAKAGSFLAISEGGAVYRTDMALQRWERIHDLGNEVRFYGIPSEIGGDDPGLQAVHLREGSMLLATAQDGYVRVDKDGVTKHLIPDQLGAPEIDRINVTVSETFFQDAWEENPWRLIEGRWTHEPVIEPDKGGEPNQGGIGRPPSEMYVPFETPDRELWAIAPGKEEDNPGLGLGEKGKLEPGKLFRRIGGRWQKVADLPGLKKQIYVSEYLDNGEMIYGNRPEARKIRRADGKGYAFPPPANGIESISDNLSVVNQAGPVWVIHDVDGQKLLSLDIRPELPSPRFARLPIEENGVPLNVYDALAWSRDEVLIATRKGLKLVEVATGKTRPAPLPLPDRSVTRLARDGLGRVWLAGDGVWLVDEKNKLHDLAEVPMVGRSKVSAMALDPARLDGVIVALGVRGVAFFQLKAGVGP